MGEFLAADAPCFALGMVEERKRRCGFLALRPEEAIPPDVTGAGFSFGHCLFGNAAFEVVQFSFHFYGFKTYNVLVNPNNPIVANGVDHHDRERRLLLFCARRRRARHGIPVGNRGDEFVRTGDQSSAHPTLDHDRRSVPAGDILFRETSAAVGRAAPLGLPRQRSLSGSRRGSSMDADNAGAGLGLPVLVAPCGSLLGKNTRGGSIVVGALNLGGSIRYDPERGP